MPERVPDSQWTDLPRLTVSSAQDLDCSKKFYELRVSKLGWGPRRGFPASVGRGTAVHDTLRSLHAGVVAPSWDGVLPMEDLDAMAREATWRARYEPGTDRDEEAARVTAAVRLFLDNQDPEDLWAILALETQIEFDYVYRGDPLARISCTVDRVLCRPDQPQRLVIQDFKTTVPKISLRESFIALWCAKKRWPDYREYVLEMIWIDAEEWQVTVETITTDQLAGQKRIITALLQRALRQPPVAEQGPACTFCCIKERCLGGLPAAQDENDEDVF